MRASSLLRSLIVSFAALGPLGAILGDTMVWRAWMDFGSDWIRYHTASFAHRWPRVRQHRFFQVLFPW